jgi:alpha-galactosidase
VSTAAWSADLSTADLPRMLVSGFRPVINGVVVDIEPTVSGTEALTTLSATVGGTTWTLTVERMSAGEVLLRCGLERPEPGIATTLDRFGLRCSIGSEGPAQPAWFMRMGATSWDGSEDVRLDRTSDAPIVGHAVAQLLPDEVDDARCPTVTLGFLRHDRFVQTITALTATTVEIETWWDRSQTDGPDRVVSATILIRVDADRQIALRRWAGAVAQITPAHVASPAAEPIVGWCSWYALYAQITEATIADRLRSLAALPRTRGRDQRDVFLIDDGFTPEMGDWLEMKPQFPRGVAPLLADARAKGFTPGLWIAPLLVGNRSNLYAVHPDWVLADVDSGAPLPVMTFYGEFRWHKRSEEYYALDLTHPDAARYLDRVLRTWRTEWGCDYFKIDFMHAGTEWGPDRARRYRTSVSRIEAWRAGLQLIRTALGDDAVINGCGCPIWASIGLVDAVRIGRDMGVEWTGEQSARSLLRDQVLRQFGNGVLWQADPDCVLLRDRFHHLSDAEVETLARFGAAAGGVLMTSDDMGELSKGRMTLWHELCAGAEAGGSWRVVRGGRDSPVVVQQHTSNAGEVTLLVTNITDTDWQGDIAGHTVSLAPHHSAMIQLGGSFTQGGARWAGW